MVIIVHARQLLLSPTIFNRFELLISSMDYGFLYRLLLRVNCLPAEFTSIPLFVKGEIKL